jgi:hypothetical protein
MSFIHSNTFLEVVELHISYFKEEKLDLLVML